VSITILYVTADVDCCREQRDSKALLYDLLSPEKALNREARGHYAGLVMFEAIVIASDEDSWKAIKQGPLPNETLCRVSERHRVLIDQFVMFFALSQHPFAGAGLRQFALNPQIPGRMFQNGVHSALKLLRHELPGSLKVVIEFTDSAYQKLLLLVTLASELSITWFECLGDVARFVLKT
jgi:hypothetical protein